MLPASQAPVLLLVLFSKLTWPSGSSCSPNEEVGMLSILFVGRLHTFLTRYSMTQYAVILYMLFNIAGRLKVLL